MLVGEKFVILTVASIHAYMLHIQNVVYILNLECVYFTPFIIKR